MKTCVLIHGCDADTSSWESIVLGDPRLGKLGRVPKAISSFFNSDAALLFWGSGAPSKEGMRESEYTFEYTLNRISEWSSLKNYKRATWNKSYLKNFSVFDFRSLNTAEEIRNCVAVCEERGIKRIILVSSPTHIARCLMEAEKLRATLATDIEFLATASDTCYAGTVPSDVVIIEPQHRGDMPKVPFHKTAQGIFQLMRDPVVAEGFNRAWGELIRQWTAKLKK